MLKKCRKKVKNLVEIKDYRWVSKRKMKEFYGVGSKRNLNLN